LEITLSPFFSERKGWYYSKGKYDQANADKNKAIDMNPRFVCRIPSVRFIILKKRIRQCLECR
jgi:hypothetical protein